LTTTISINDGQNSESDSGASLSKTTSFSIDGNLSFYLSAVYMCIPCFLSLDLLDQRSALSPAPIIFEHILDDQDKGVSIDSSKSDGRLSNIV